MTVDRQKIIKLLRDLVEENSSENDCESYVEFIGILAESSLNGPVETEVETHFLEHLQSCSECKEVYEMIRKIAEEGHFS